MDLSQIAAEVTAAAEELIAVARPKEGRIFVLGCSTSEVLGSAIGTARSPETAETIISAVLGLDPLVQTGGGSHPQPRTVPGRTVL